MSVDSENEEEKTERQKDNSRNDDTQKMAEMLITIAVESIKVAEKAQDLQPKEEYEQACFPMINLLFGAINILLFYLSIRYCYKTAGDDPDKTDSCSNWGGQWSEALDTFGLNNGPMVKEGGVWRIIANNFLHLNFKHICGNLAFGLPIGSYLECNIGHWNMFLLIIIVSFCSGITDIAVDYEIRTLGYSAVVFGINGAMVAYAIMYGYRLRNPFTTIFMTLIESILLEIIRSSNPVGGVNHTSHIVGAVIGILTVGTLLKLGDANKREEDDEDDECQMCDEEVCPVFRRYFCGGILVLWTIAAITFFIYQAYFDGSKESLLEIMKA